MDTGVLKHYRCSRFDGDDAIYSGIAPTLRTSQNTLQINTLPDTNCGHRIGVRALYSDLLDLPKACMGSARAAWCMLMWIGSMLIMTAIAGCATHHEAATVDPPPPEPPQVVVVVAPVLNLSNNTDWDPLKVTDILASELQSFPGVVVIPVNRTLAALALRGKTAVETSQDALDLAREFNADATVVAAITEYDPYDPPRVGLIVQWYALDRRGAGSTFDPVSASRQATAAAPAAELARDAAIPLYQVQRVFSAADRAVIKDIKSYAKQRDGHKSPYDWQIYTKSQELFVRYCCWAAIRPISKTRNPSGQATPNAEADSWKQDGDV
jgi:hypothetical protein